MAATATQLTTKVNFMGNIPIIDPKLDGSNNYASCKFLMRMTLIEMDLWECVTIHLRLTATAKDAWVILNQVYEDKGLSCVLNLMRAFLKLDYNDFHNMNEYVAEALSLSQKLADVGNPIEDKLLTSSRIQTHGHGTR
ncbi:hypothetical protein K0M31_008958 [Melipona bicolor]|uniref:Uncharacterized protein n=1 Tax=Melipona bicolor TaxID=60889 RepID=A0AA40FQV1_9HYME|nr:hypothetical protein K0M31_008958 [Melipona bicolor]